MGTWCSSCNKMKEVGKMLVYNAKQFMHLTHLMYSINIIWDKKGHLILKHIMLV